MVPVHFFRESAPGNEGTTGEEATLSRSKLERKGDLDLAGPSHVHRRRVLQGALQGSSPANCPPLCRVEGISVCLGMGLWAGDCSSLGQEVHGRSRLTPRALTGYGVTVCVKAKRLSAPLTLANSPPSTSTNCVTVVGTFRTT